jgi:hypothetical protein
MHYNLICWEFRQVVQVLSGFVGVCTIVWDEQGLTPYILAFKVFRSVSLIAAELQLCKSGNNCYQ